MLKPIAIHLPQFYPFRENDEWWGKGFTEWTNVTKAKPLFKDHYQPHLPSDLGFYDLRLEESRVAQAELAKQYGIYGFCYYHYWFNGRRILDRPFQEIFESKKPDFPFMLCWANENWTRRWDGFDKSILLEQRYSEEDDRNHIRQLIEYFKDFRYIRINNKPVVAIYKSEIIPNVSETIRIWRDEASKIGMELYICRFENFGKYGEEYVKKGFDAAVEFQPFSEILDRFKEADLNKRLNHSLVNRMKMKLNKVILSEDKYTDYCSAIFNRFDYNDYIDFIKANYSFPANYTRFPGIMPSWDNTARTGKKGFLFQNANPQKYLEWVKYIKDNYTPPSAEENLIFINAWNEWAEGCHLEPDQKWGRAYLEATAHLNK